MKQHRLLRLVVCCFTVGLLLAVLSISLGGCWSAILVASTASVLALSLAGYSLSLP